MGHPFDTDKYELKVKPGRRSTDSYILVMKGGPTSSMIKL